MQRFVYVQTVNVQTLPAQLEAAIPALAPVVTPEGNVAAYRITVQATLPTPTIGIEVADGVAQSAVNAVMTAHNPSVLAPIQVQVAADNGNLSDLAAMYQNMVAKLDSIQVDLAAMSTRATTLSTVTISGTLANTQAQVQANLRGIGADLKTFVDDMNAFTVGSERVLKVLAVVVRRTQGGA